MNKKPLLKVMTVIGTRPEIIRLSRIIPVLDEHVNHVLVHTGQNYDYELNEIFFDDLNLRKPDYFMNVDNSTLGSAVGDIIRRSEEVLKREKPNALLVLGDTNSCLSAYMAKRMHIPIFHMEAGNRCFDFTVPEEINRRIIDHISDFNLVYTEHARRHLLSEGLHHRKIYLTGSPIKEVLEYNKEKIDSSTILNQLKIKNGNYFVVSIHREENVENSDILNKIIKNLFRVIDKYNYPLIFSTHPRTKKRIIALDPVLLNDSSKIMFHKPFSFTDYIHLQQNAFCTISDSGTISEESSILHFPAVTLRSSMERPEALDTGSIILTGHDERTLLKAIEIMTKMERLTSTSNIPEGYKINNTSVRVLKLIVGLSPHHVHWS